MDSDIGFKFKSTSRWTHLYYLYLGVDGETLFCSSDESDSDIDPSDSFVITNNFYSYLYMDGLDVSAIDMHDPIVSELSQDPRIDSFLSALYNIKNSVREGAVDAFAFTLLRELGFQSLTNNMNIELQREFEFVIRDQTVKSVPDIVIEKSSQCTGSYYVYVEDKGHKSVYLHEGDYRKSFPQVLGELLCQLYNRCVEDNLRPGKCYVISFIGNFFIVYWLDPKTKSRTKVSETFMNSNFSNFGFHRSSPYNVFNPEERVKIINILLKLKDMLLTGINIEL